MLKSAFIALAILLILPVASISAPDDIIIDSHGASRDKVGVGPVRFPHARHKKRYKCAVCHPKIFKAKRGANNITMKLNMNRKFCGAPNCHSGRTPKAFPLYNCAKCHTSVKGG
jgi:c(7)-type cytochrome triheme protein